MNRAKKLLGLLEKEKEGSYEKEQTSLKKQIADLHDKLLKMESDPKSEASELQKLRDQLAELNAKFHRMI